MLFMGTPSENRVYSGRVQEVKKGLLDVEPLTDQPLQAGLV